jgi:hypothetical protein
LKPPHSFSHSAVMASQVAWLRLFVFNKSSSHHSNSFLKNSYDNSAFQYNTGYFT